MCWLRWISSGRFSQERGVKKKEGKKGRKLGWLKSGVGVTFEAGVVSLFRSGSGNAASVNLAPSSLLYLHIQLLIYRPVLPLSCSRTFLFSFPPSLAACLLSLFQGWWLWLESRHRWQASLPSGEGLRSLKLPPFSSFLLLFSSAQTFGLQLCVPGELLSRRA